MKRQRYDRPRVRDYPREPPFTGVLHDGDHLEWTRALVLDNGLIHPKSKSRTAVERALPDANNAADSLYALNTLQQRENAPANDHVLMKSLETLVSYLPEGVDDTVYTGEQPGESADFAATVTDEAFAAGLDRRWPEDHPMFRNIKLGKFLFWPINTGPDSAHSLNDHYVTVVLVLRQKPALVRERKRELADPMRVDDESLQVPVPYDEVVQWSVVDPKRSHFERDPDGAGVHVVDGRTQHRHEDRVQRVKKRVQTILERGKLEWDFATDYMTSGHESAPYSLPWVPHQIRNDDWSSGLRSFALIKQLTERLVHGWVGEYIPIVEGSPVGPFWAATSGWWNPHQVRHEMMGYLAIRCIADMRWKARIAIEPLAGNLDAIEGQDKFAAKRLKPRAGTLAYFPTDNRRGPDTTHVSKGFPEEDEDEDE